MLRLALACITAFVLAAPAVAAEPLRIHLVSGAREYKSEPSLKAFKAHLEEHYDVTCTASWGHDGIKELENLDALRRADLLILFARRMKLTGEQMQVFRDHWKAGKPVIGIRTASHAFSREENEVFDKQVLGNHYSGHYGNEPVTVTATEAGAKHPVLAGVGAIGSKRLYKAGELAEKTVVLQNGSIGKGTHPVTLVHEYAGGRMFYTSLGVPEDFEDEDFRRMLVNAVAWTTKRDVKELAK